MTYILLFVFLLWSNINELKFVQIQKKHKHVFSELGWTDAFLSRMQRALLMKQTPWTQAWLGVG